MPGSFGAWRNWKPQPTNAGRFGFTGQLSLEYISGLRDLYDYKARIYAAHLGRFLQTDPIGRARYATRSLITG